MEQTSASGFRATIAKNWFTIGDVTFDRYRLYQNVFSAEDDAPMRDLVDARGRVYIAPFGGAHAVAYDGALPQSREVVISSASGQQLGIVALTRQPPILGWTNTEFLLAVEESGNYTAYAINGRRSFTYQLPLTLPAPPTDDATAAAAAAAGLAPLPDSSHSSVEIVAGCTFAQGFAAITSAPSVVVVADAFSPHPTTLFLGHPFPETLDMSCVDATIITRHGALYVDVAIGGSKGEVSVVSLESTAVGSTVSPPCVTTELGCGGVRLVSWAQSVSAVAAWTSSGTLVVCAYAPAGADTPPTLVKTLTLRFEGASQLQRLLWCGGAAVMCVWRVLSSGEDGDDDDLQTGESKAVLVTPRGKVKSIVWDGPIGVVSDVDCVRILSLDGMDVLTLVPKATLSVVGETPAAALLTAYLRFSAGHSESVMEVLRGTPRLADSLRLLLSAATQQVSKPAQQILLRAAAWGKTFVLVNDAASVLGDGEGGGATSGGGRGTGGEGDDPSEPLAETLENATRELRVLNALRDSAVAIPLSLAQYRRAQAASVVFRLAYRSMFILASSIAAHLKLSPSVHHTLRVLWATSLVADTSRGDDEVCAQVESRLMGAGSGGSIRVDEVAQTAVHFGRPELAVKILERAQGSGSSHVHVSLLLRMGELEKALALSVPSGDMSLLLLCAQVIAPEPTAGPRPPPTAAGAIDGGAEARSSLPPQVASCYALLSKYPPAARAHVSFYLLCGKIAEACDIADLCGLPSLAAALAVTRAAEDPARRLAKATEAANATGAPPPTAAQLLQRREAELRAAASRYNALEKGCVEARLLDTGAALLKRQGELEAELRMHPNTLVNSSLNQTVRMLYAYGHASHAGAVAKHFKMSDKASAYARLRGLALGDRWDDVARLASESKSVIGWLPHVEVCVKAAPQQLALARKFVAKISDPSTLVDAHVALGNFQSACDVAAGASADLARELMISIQRRTDNKKTRETVSKWLSDNPP